MLPRNQSDLETYAEAKKVAPHINDLLIQESSAVRTAIERDGRALPRKYEPRRVFINNVVETIGGALMLSGPMLVWTVGDLEKTAGFREHAHLLALGGIGIMAITAISQLSNHYQRNLYRAFAYVQRQESSGQQPTGVDIPYAKVNLENLVHTTL